MDKMDKENIKSRVSELVDGDGYKPVLKSGLASLLELPAAEWDGFYDILKDMECSGLLILSKSGKVLSMKNSGLFAAKIQSITKTGGFATIPGREQDVFIKKPNLNGSMPTDIVLIKMLKGSGRLEEAGVVKVIKRNFSEFTGVYHRHGKQGFLIADSFVRDKIPVAGGQGAAKDGDKVFARYRGGSAEIVTDFGQATVARSCCKAVLSKYHVRTEFPAPVLKEAERAAQSKVEPAGRLDLRDRIIFTIDGASSKDLDDAVSVERTENGYRLGVHIADVSYYVKAGSPLDEEAYKRGTSIYYADAVIPMLPKELSNGICSLNPNEDRYAFSVFMDMDEEGAVKGCEIKKSVIRSKVKGVYEEINRIFDGTADAGINRKYGIVMPSLALMRELSAKLTERKNKRGALDIESPDSKVTVDENGVAVSVEKRVQGETENLIEEFMLSANEAVASYVCRLEMPLVYRVHDEPEPKKLDDLKQVLGALGINAKKIRPGIRPQDLSEVIKKMDAIAGGGVLSSLALRAMAKARYSPDCTGHFGLALEYYCHFTSPIRRYPDLAVHRILNDLIAKGASGQLADQYREFTVEASLASSEHEVTAMQVERECESIYKAEYMAAHLGERFDGVISSVRPYGFYAALESSVEGLCRAEDIPGGYWELDEKNMRLVCKNSRRKYALGDAVKVIVARADVSTGQVDFQLA